MYLVNCHRNPNGLGLGLDVAGGALLLAFPAGSVAGSIGGAVVGAIGLGAAIADSNLLTGSAAYAGKQSSVADGLFKGTSRFARFAGIGALATSTAYDVSKAIDDYKKCLQGK